MFIMDYRKKILMLRTIVFLPMLMHFEHAITISLTVVQSTKLAAACQMLTRPRSTKGQRTVINVTTSNCIILVTVYMKPVTTLQGVRHII